jgi:hypothetical protein
MKDLIIKWFNCGFKSLNLRQNTMVYLTFNKSAKVYCQIYALVIVFLTFDLF